jgi:hypothetical protein
MDLTTIAFGVLVGLALSRLVNFFIGLGKVLIWLQDAEKTALQLLFSAAESASYIQNMKYEQMERLGVDVEQIKLQKQIDDEIYRTWRETAILSLLNSYTERFSKNRTFYDWESAIKAYNKINEREK